MVTRYDFSGVWRSEYLDAKNEKQSAKHSQTNREQYVTMRLMGNQLTVESLPSSNHGYILARFTIDNRVATGSYQSQNTKQLSYGAAQLVLSEDGRSFRGMMVGFDDEMVVRAGGWQISYVAQQLSAAKKR